jgi:hypothetical protein
MSVTLPLRELTAEDVMAGCAVAAPQCPACSYLTWGHPAGGPDRWLCVLAEGNCPFQDDGPTTGGRRVCSCLRSEASPADSVRPGVTAGARTRLPELARRMVDAGAHRLSITDDSGGPVGVVTCADLLAALAAEAGA